MKPRLRLVNGWWECSSPGATGKAVTPAAAWRAWYQERWAWLPPEFRRVTPA